MKKKILFLFLLLFASITLVACGKGGVKISKTKLSLGIGQSETLEVTIPDDQVDKLEVSSNNEGVATVSLTGNKVKVTAVATGKAVITVKLKDTNKSTKVEVTVTGAATGARFTGADEVLIIDVSQELEVALQDAIAGVKAFDKDGSDITNKITFEGAELIDVTADVGTQFQIKLVVTLSDGTKLEKVVTVEIFGEVVQERIVIFGPDKLTYYIGSVGFDFKKEFSAQNLTTHEDVEVKTEFMLDEELTLTIPGQHTVIVSAEQGDIKTEKSVQLTVKPKVEIKNTLIETSEAAPIKIRFAHGNGQDIEALFKKYATQFETKMKEQDIHVQIEVEKAGANYDEVRNAITSLMQQNAPLPNIIQNYPDHLVEYHGHGKIISLAPYAFHPTWGFGDGANENFYDIIQSYRDEQRAASLEGDLLSLPFNKSTEFIIYNKDMFDEVLRGKKFPETWEDLFSYADALKAQAQANVTEIARKYTVAANPNFTAAEQQKALDNFYAFSYDSGGNAFITLTKAWGGEYTQQTGIRQEKLRFVNDQTKQMLNYFGENRSNFTSPAVWDNARYATDLFLKGYSAFSVSSSAGADKNAPLVPSSTTTVFNIGVAPMLYSKLYPEKRNVIQQGTNFSITTEGTDDQKIVSWLFLKFLNLNEVSLDYAFEKGYYPTRYSTLDTQEYKDFLSLYDKPIRDGMARAEVEKIMRAKAAQIYFLQKEFMVYDLPFKGSSGVRGKVEEAFKDIMLAAKDANLTTVINNALQKAYDESLRLVSDD